MTKYIFIFSFHASCHDGFRHDSVCRSNW